MWNHPGLNFFESIVQVAIESPVIAGVVFGRTDFSGSLGMKGDVQNDKVTECIEAVARKLQTDLDLVVGGELIASLPELNRIAQYRLTRFETRKVGG